MKGKLGKMTINEERKQNFTLYSWKNAYTNFNLRIEGVIYIICN